MTDEMKMIEITDAETTVSEIALPSKITGYLAFYRNLNYKWEQVTTFDANKQSHPIIPHCAYETKQEAVKSAMSLKYAKMDSIKIVAVEFEV
jgi:hypothetical protein